VNLLYVGKRIGVQVSERIPLLVGGSDIDIVDVEKQAASRVSD